MKFFDRLFRRNKETKSTPAPVALPPVVESSSPTRSSLKRNRKASRKHKRGISKASRRKNR